MKRSLLALAAPALFVATGAAQAPFKNLNRNAPMPVITAGYDMCAGDVDGDGDVDLVVGNDHDPNQLFLNDGRGGFVDATAGRLTTPPSNATYEVDLADIDGDGDLDLLLVNDHFLPNRVHVNNGLGFFTDVSATALPANNDHSIDQVVADFDGDGDVDWLVCNDFPVSGSLYLNNGQGVFSIAPGAVPAGAGGFAQSFAADLDQDGDLDIVLSNSSMSGSGPILVNQGNAVFAYLAPNPIPVAGIVHAADVDGDGRLDLLTNNGTVLRRNLGGLTFAPAVAVPGQTYGSVDFDGDGDVDLVGPSHLLVNNGTGTFTAITSGTGIGPYSLCVADLDGDGDPDLVDSNCSNSSARFNLRTQVHTPAAPVRGQAYDVQLHGGTAAAPVLFGLAVSAAGAALPLPPFGTLRLDMTQGVLLGGVLATASPTTVTSTIPNNPALVGFQLHHQSIVFAPNRPPFLSNSLRDVVQ